MELNELRNQIDQIDKEMAVLFEKRMKIVKQIGEYKKENNLPILDKKREEEVIERILNIFTMNILSLFIKSF